MIYLISKDTLDLFCSKIRVATEEVLDLLYVYINQGQGQLPGQGQGYLKGQCDFLQIKYPAPYE